MRYRFLKQLAVFTASMALAIYVGRLYFHWCTTLPSAGPDAAVLLAPCVVAVTLVVAFYFGAQWFGL